MSDSTNAGGWLIANRYRVTGRLGSGGMADVFRAHDELLKRDVAVKVFRTVTHADTAAGAERQSAELHALARLNHPHLITLFDGSVEAKDGHDASVSSRAVGVVAFALCGALVAFGLYVMFTTK